MSKRFVVALPLVLTILGLALLVTLSQRAKAEVPLAAARTSKGDIVMMSCRTGSSAFTVTTYQGSTAGPPKKTDSCPQTLSDLVREGFTIRHIGVNEEVDFFVYTLER